MALGDAYREAIVTADGRHLVAEVLAVEPVADVAVLGAPDDQARPDLAHAFEAFCQSIKPVPPAPLWLVRQMVPPSLCSQLDAVLPSGRWSPGEVWAERERERMEASRTPTEVGEGE